MYNDRNIYNIVIVHEIKYFVNSLSFCDVLIVVGVVIFSVYMTYFSSYLPNKDLRGRNVPSLNCNIQCVDYLSFSIINSL